MVGGDDRVSRFRDASVNEDYDVQLRLKQGDRNDIETISRLFVSSTKVGLVQLDNLVTLEKTDSSSRIDRLDRQRQVSFRAGVAPWLRARRSDCGNQRGSAEDESAARL